MVSRETISWAYLMFFLLFWCHRKCLLIWYLTCLREVLLPLFLCKTSPPLWMTSTLQIQRKGHHLSRTWWPMDTSLLWQTQHMKVKHQTVQCMLSLTTGSLGLYLSENSVLRLNKIKMQNMLPSVFPEHVSDWNGSMWWCHGTGRGKVINHTAEEGNRGGLWSYRCTV